jgi:GT2 family glycosyltransferase
MTVSIIIAVKTWQKNLEECVGKCLELGFSDFEILILPDSQEGASAPELLKKLQNQTIPVEVIPTGPLSPAKKRDMAMSYAKGQILAFIDDDAYPRRDWLEKALENFKDNKVAAVGGPAVTPPEDTLKQKISGRIYESVLVSGNYVYRYLPRKKREVEDFPSCNLFVRKEIMLKLGGFLTDFWPGEDTKLCLEIIKLGKKIIYDPDVLVYHHRRRAFKPHLKQIAAYAMHRGYFVKRFPRTSLKIIYFVPSLFVAGLLFGGALAIFFPIIRILYVSAIFLYMVLTFLASLTKDIRLILPVWAGTFLTHFTYGVYFVSGLLAKRLKDDR